MNTNRKRILTGDRPTGSLHLGHYLGSLKNRFDLQDEYDCFFIVADCQALTTHYQRTEEIEDNIREAVLDYLSAGLNLEKSVCFLQSSVPQLPELTVIFSMIVPVSRLYRNPTIKEELKEMGMKGSMTYGFVGYPVSQAADILLFRPHLVPVGDDQLPHIEQTREIADRFNKLYFEVFPTPEPLLGPRLLGTDGRRKMGKSYNNAIFLADSEREIEEKIKGMFTDPGRPKRGDPGHPDACVAFSYFEVFGENIMDEISESCRKARIGCVECKTILAKEIDGFLEPFRERRKFYEGRPGLIRDILNFGASEARVEGAKTMEMVREAMGLDYRSLLG